jgi:uroporphyrin-III C-methyltransferase/precorrin-2 dehydrogenase/sirohydrochlorin ferrochelatase/uroporphyrin-III C-methyltransferase
MGESIEVKGTGSLFALGADNRRPFLPGEVVLIGAGPGDAELLTVRAYKLIQEADCVVYDRLVSEDVMALVAESAESIYVGKQSNNHALPQEDINKLLIEKAKAGRKVARLKGGDSFIFGRGGEEVQCLLDAGVYCRVVPGITAASACTSYSGIPLTHRDYVHGCTFVTGHLKNELLDLPWEALARDDHTLVVYMGIKTASVLSKSLIEHKLDPRTPVALISDGTSLKHRTYKTTLEDLPEFIMEHSIKAPTLIVVGKVVNALDVTKKVEGDDELRHILNSWEQHRSETFQGLAV